MNSRPSPPGPPCGGIAAPGMENVVAAGATLRVGRVGQRGQTRVVDRVVLASVADAPLPYPPTQRGLSSHEFNRMHDAFRCQLLHGRNKNATCRADPGKLSNRTVCVLSSSMTDSV